MFGSINRSWVAPPERGSMNTFNISAMIEYAYRQSGGDVGIVNQCEAALEELSALINAAQQSFALDRFQRGSAVFNPLHGTYRVELPSATSSGK